MNEPKSRGDWEVFVLEYARSKDQPVASLIQGALSEGTFDLPFSFVLARRADAVVLVDSGFMRDGSGEKMAQKFGVPYWISPLRLLSELGVSAGEVTDIVLTHAHFDHMGSIDRFPKARIHMQKRELLGWIEYLALPRRYSWLSEIVNPDNIRQALDAAVEHRLDLLDGDKDDLLPGLHVRLGTGHTPGHQFVVIESARGNLAVTGDCLYAPYQLTGRGGDGVYVPLTNAVGTPYEQLRTFDRLNEAVDHDLSRLVILHDPKAWASFPLVKKVEGFTIAKAS